MGPIDDAGPPVGGRGRTVLVIGEDVELAVALRDRLDRTYVTVCEVRTAEALAALRACRPWPWMVIGDGSHVPESIVKALAEQPILLLWRGARPPGLPAHAYGSTRFSELAGAAERAISAEVAGIRLAPGAGLTMPDGKHAGNAALEALVANHPRPLFTQFRHFRAATATLDSHGIPLRVARSITGGISLTATQGR